MNLSTKYFLTVIWVLLLYAIGTWLFFRGFLLKRSVVTQNSTCVERPALAAVSGPDDLCDGAGCWMPRRFDRAVVLVIDALRYDFVAYNSSIDISAELPYQNKLKMLNELLERKPQNTRLYHFWADPPTTTMQRLKGLTTGSLPTFVDVSSNFDTAEITEDNFIDQFVKSNRQIVFMGDDTWTHLFPGRFAKQFDFPSFNVKDLHTVDNGVIEHLIPEMKRSNWDLLIGHFLGVDHCGHRYGPQHPAMAEKLAQLDGVLRTVIAELDNDTVLFVFGDHGMTGTGDHGGDSSNELDAALLVYSPSVISMEPPQQGNYGSVSQVDLVPTISLLVGLPIPFSNLGSVIPELFSFCSSWNASSHKENSILRSIEALRLNAQQMQRYLLAYTTVTDEFPYVLFSDLTSQLRRLESTLNDTLRTWDVSHKHSLKQLEALKQGYESYLQRGKAMCQEIWVNFNVASIVLGITMISAALLLSIFLYNSVPPNGQFTTSVYIMFATTLAVFLLVLFLWFLDLTFVSLLPSLLLGLLTTVVFAVMFINVLATEPLTWRLVLQDLFTSITRPNTASLFSVLSLGLHVAAYFSNSFVVYEDQVTMFLLQTWLCVHFFTMNTCLVGPDRSGIEPTQRQRRYHAKFDVGRVLTSPRSIALLLTLAVLVCVRLGGNFRGCREEQWLCERSTFLRPLMSLTTTTHKNVRYFLSVMSVVVVVVGVYHWLRYHGNLNGHSPVVMCQRYSLPITGVAISLYWAMQTLPRNILENLHGWQVTVFPRIAYILTGTTFLCTAIAPLCVFSPHVLNIAPGSGSNYIPRAFNHIKYNWRKHLGPRTAERGAVTERKPPVVYGLATVYSSAFLVLTATLALLLMLVLRDGLAPSIVLHLATMFLVLELHASGQRLSDSNTEGDYSAPWSCVCCWALLASHNFFATGQQNVFQTIQWEMAYTGFHGDFDVNIIPATVLILNTFAGHIIGAFTLPLLVYWPQVRGDVLFYFGMREGGGSDGKGMRQKGELRLHEDPAGLRTASLKIILGFLIFSGAKLLGATSAAGLHRRHLMVWKIFAPRVIYEGATFLVLGPLLLLVFLIMLRIDRALSGWLGDLVK